MYCIYHDRFYIPHSRTCTNCRPRTEIPFVNEFRFICNTILIKLCTGKVQFLRYKEFMPTFLKVYKNVIIMNSGYSFFPILIPNTLHLRRRKKIISHGFYWSRRGQKILGKKPHRGIRNKKLRKVKFQPKRSKLT